MSAGSTSTPTGSGLSRCWLGSSLAVEQDNLPALAHPATTLTCRGDPHGFHVNAERFRNEDGRRGGAGHDLDEPGRVPPRGGDDGRLHRDSRRHLAGRLGGPSCRRPGEAHVPTGHLELLILRTESFQLEP